MNALLHFIPIFIRFAIFSTAACFDLNLCAPRKGGPEIQP